MIEKKEFCWEAVLALHPDKFAKINTQSSPSPLTPPPSPRPQSLPTYAMLDVLRKMKEKQSGLFRHRTTSKSVEWVPNVVNCTFYICVIIITYCEAYILFNLCLLIFDYFSNFSNELKAKWMTPAMEEIMRLRKKAIESPSPVSNSRTSNQRLTRSRVATLKRKSST